MIKKIVFFSFFLFISCLEKNFSSSITLDFPMFFTKIIPETELDSIGFLNRKHQIVVTDKKGKILSYSAMKGELKHFIERPNSYPNGVNIINDQYVLITERDNHQVLILDSSLNYIGEFGKGVLKYPYGITSYQIEKNQFRVFVTDNFKEGTISSERIIFWDLTLSNNSEIAISEPRIFGNSGLYEVESIIADSYFNRLFVAEENSKGENNGSSIIVLDLVSGEEIQCEISNFYFENDAEGIALTGIEDGYIIFTEQSKEDNKFHLFSRSNLSFYKTLFLEDVSFTDGIATAYMHGEWYLYAIDNDKRVAAFKLPQFEN